MTMREFYTPLGLLATNHFLAGDKNAVIVAGAATAMAPSAP